MGEDKSKRLRDVRSGMLRVLVVSEAYYPLMLMGSHRAGKLVKLLPEFGWQPTVLTLREEEHHECIDETLRTQIPADVRVVRTRYFGIRMLRRVKHALGRRWLARGAAVQAAPGDTNAKNRASLFNWMEVPDAGGWLPFGVWRGLGPARQSDAIWATSPSTAGLCIGAILSRLTGKPLVADLRDPWRVEEARPYPTRFHRRVDHRWERFVYATASRIVVVTPHMLRALEQRYPEHRGKLRLIYNGYDEEDFEASDPVALESAEGEIKIGYFGSLSVGRERCVRALLVVTRAMREAGDGFKVRMYYRGVGEPAFRALCAQTNTEDLADIGGRSSYGQTLALMKAMDVLLLLGSAEHVYALPGKLFEYIGAKKPILAVTPPGAIHDFLMEHGVGVPVDPDKPDEIAGALARLVRHDPAFVSRMSEASGKFTRRQMAAQTAKVLDEVRCVTHRGTRYYL